MIEGVVRNLAARCYFALCLAFGRVLRSARYSTVQGIYRDGERAVRKRRRFYAPLLIWLGDPLAWILDTGVRVLPQRDWHERERRLHVSLRRTSIRMDADGSLVLPLLAGRTLATWLADPTLEEARRKAAIRQAVLGLAEFHRLGFTHGDAMAENVIVDLEDGVAHWFDFETAHDAARPMAWRRADDLRALLVTALVRAAPADYRVTLDLILDAYADEDVARVLATSVTPVWRRSLTFHLAQAPLSFHGFREIGRLLAARRPPSG